MSTRSWGKRSLGEAWGIIFTPQTIGTFLLGSLALSILGNAAFQVFANWLGTSTPAMLGLIAGMIGALLTAAWVLARVLHRLRRLPDRLPKKHQPGPRRGIILLVGKEEVCQQALRHHEAALTHCWLIYTDMTAELSRKICDQLEQSGKDVQRAHVADVFGTGDCQQVVDSIYNTLPDGLSPDDVILDFTGLTALASLGAVLGALAHDAPLQYTPAVYGDRGPMGALEPILIDVTPPVSRQAGHGATAAVASASGSADHV